MGTFPGHSTTWGAKPPSSVTINRGHPLAQGLVACCLFNEQCGLTTVDIAAGLPGTLSRTDLWDNAGIRALGGGSTAQDIIFDANSAVTRLWNNASPAFSVTARIFVHTAGLNSNPVLVGLSSSASSTPIYVMYGPGNGSGNCQYRVFMQDDAGSGGNVFVGPSTWGATQSTITHSNYSKTARSFYIDGRLAGTDTTSKSTTTFDRYRLLRLFRPVGSQYGANTSTLLMLLIHNRPLQQAEAAALHADPYCFLVPA